VPPRWNYLAINAYSFNMGLSLGVPGARTQPTGVGLSCRIKYHQVLQASHRPRPHLTGGSTCIDSRGHSPVVLGAGVDRRRQFPA
jgi:hypothetical protein